MLLRSSARVGSPILELHRTAIGRGIESRRTGNLHNALKARIRASGVCCEIPLDAMSTRTAGGDKPLWPEIVYKQVGTKLIACLVEDGAYREVYPRPSRRYATVPALLSIRAPQVIHRSPDHRRSLWSVPGSLAVPVEQRLVHGNAVGVSHVDLDGVRLHRHAVRSSYSLSTNGPDRQSDHIDSSSGSIPIRRLAQFDQ